MQLRNYQKAAVEAVYHYLRTKKGNPCIVAPTGSGKSRIIAAICADSVKRWSGRVLVLAHVKELLEQTASTLRRVDSTLEIGVYSAGLKSRDTEHPIIVAGIQSVYKRAAELGTFNLILIDECHLIAPDGEGMYRTFLAESERINPNIRLIGLTATPFRMKTGLLCGPDNLLTDVCYDIGVRDLIDAGILSPIRSKSSPHALNCSGLHVRAGEFITSEMEELVDNEKHVYAACREIVTRTADRKSVLIFAVSVNHAKRVKAALEKITAQECGIVTGETPASERDVILRRFKNEPVPASLFGDTLPPIKYLVNVNVLTTGFDAPNIDCVVLLRPTASAGLFAQMVGRGLRKCDGKMDCLIMDYGENIKRHGPIDALYVKDKHKMGGEAPQKVCPNCFEYVHAAVLVCPECGFTFDRKEKGEHEAKASDAGILSGEITDTVHEVQKVYYRIHEKRGKPDAPKTVKIDYQTGFNQYVSEWKCPEHDGWVRQSFERWWSARSNDPPPQSAEDAVRLADAGSLAVPTRITVREISGERFPKVTKYKLPDTKPEAIGPLPEKRDYDICSECSWYSKTGCGKYNEDTEPERKACDFFDFGFYADF